MRRWLLWAVAALGILVTVVLVVGWSLPVAHRASRTRTFVNAAPDRVFAVIADFSRYPEWRLGVTRVEVEGLGGVGQTVREYGSNGEIPFSVEIFEPPGRMMTRIASDGLPFGGAWTYELRSDEAGNTELTITEDGEVYNLFFRFMSRFVFGHHATMDGYLRDLEKQLARR
jgi:hypothetical protein